MISDRTEDLLRELAPQVLGALVRRYGHFDAAEDATQEALIAAATAWPADGRPDNPRAWLITVAGRRLTDILRNERARRRREDVVAQATLPGGWHSPGADQPRPADDSLILLFMCAHPAVSPASQIALTLRAVGGLTTAEVARAFLTPEATMTRRITRAKSAIKDSAAPFRMPPPAERPARLAAVLRVLYLIFNEGYASTGGPHLVRVELTAEAIRLARLLHRLLPDDPEVTGLLALMLLTDARRVARVAPDGMPVPMAEQDRSTWNAAAIAEGIALVTAALPKGATGPYQLQAAIAAIHDEASSTTNTDWPQIVALYELLMQIDESPVVALNHAVAVAMTDGATVGLACLERLGADERLRRDRRFHAVRAHLLEMSGEAEEARAAYELAASRPGNVQQRRYLYARAAAISRRPDDADPA